MRLNFATAKSYLDIVTSAIELNNVRGYKTQVANAAGCQLSYLSQVLAGNAHFTQDQVFQLAKFFRLSDLETEIFMKLHARDRTSTHELRSHFDVEIDKLVKKQQHLTNRLSAKTAVARQAEEYYSSWYHAAIHVALSIPELQTVQALEKILGLSAPQIHGAVALLMDMGLAKQTGDRYQIVETNVHLPSTSKLNTINHINWRIFFCNQLQKKPSATDLHYSAVHSIAEKDLLKLRELMIQFIDQSRQLVAPSKEERLIAVGVDFCVL